MIISHLTSQAISRANEEMECNFIDLFGILTKCLLYTCPHNYVQDSLTRQPSFTQFEISYNVTVHASTEEVLATCLWGHRSIKNITPDNTQNPGYQIIKLLAWYYEDFQPDITNLWYILPWNMP